MSLHNEAFKRFFPELGNKHDLFSIQEKAIESIVNKGNTLCIIPTSGGKSLIYWVAGMELGGTTIVVSPLISLIDDQVSKLKSHNIECLVLHGGIGTKNQVKKLTDFAQNKINPKFIFASPEKMATDGFFEYCMKVRRNDITAIVIDEVHCVSQWGISFRPFYARIPDFLDNVFGKGLWPRILALTATLNGKEVEDICSAFKIPVQNIIQSEILMRTEIQLHVSKFVNEVEKEKHFWEIVQRHKGEKTLVYLYRKKGERGVENLYQKAIEKGYRAALFHGDMSAAERNTVLNQLKSGDVDLIIATNAFGMGIDIPDIRVVIHFMIPESAEQYYQEVGRAARDGNGANAYLLYTDKNIDIKRRYFIDRSFPDCETLIRVYKKIAKRKGILVWPYFDDDEVQECFPYYLSSGLMKIICKGFSGLSSVYEITDENIRNLYNSSRTHDFVKTAEKAGISPEMLSETMYSGLVNEKYKLKKPFERWLVLEIKETEISDSTLQIIMSDIAGKKEYKHNLLDYFIYLLQGNPNSQELHQEIAIYLGMDKFNARRIYRTEDGNHVRSKSEVIISDHLYHAGIDYQYEEPLEYEKDMVISPDFTVYLSNGEKRYWEHIGMIGNLNYESKLKTKLEIYERYFPGMLIKTYETGVISKDAELIIEKLKSI